MLKIRELREEAQLTQRQLAERLSNMQRNVSNWEKGVSEPDLQTVVAIADIFNVTLDELFCRNIPQVLPDDEDLRLVRAVKRLSPQKKAALYNLLKNFED